MKYIKDEERQEMADRIIIDDLIVANTFLKLSLIANVFLLIVVVAVVLRYVI